MKRFIPLLVLLLVLLSVPISDRVNGFPNICGSAITQAATDITPTTATLNGQVLIPELSLHDRHGDIIPADYELADVAPETCTVYFQYGTTSGVYPLSTPPVANPHSSTIRSVSRAVGDLTPCTTYFARIVIHCSFSLIQRQSPLESLFALASTDSWSAFPRGLGFGFSGIPARGSHYTVAECTAPGNEISFTTLGCQVGNVHSSLATGGVGQGGVPTNLSNIVTSAATISNTKVSPGEQVDVIATLINKGNANGALKINLYVNDELADSRGVTLSAGESAPVHFYVTRNEPGTYTVRVGNIPAGSFTVDLFSNNDILIYGVIAVFTLGIVGVIILLSRRRRA